MVLGRYFLLGVFTFFVCITGILSYPQSAWAACLAGDPSPPGTTDIITALPASPRQIDVFFVSPPISPGDPSISGFYVTRKAGSETVFSEQPFTSSPISHWKFDGCSTGFRDFGSLANADLTQGGSAGFDLVNQKIVGSYSFDGTSRFLTAPDENDYDFVTPFSVSFWMKADAQNNVAVVSKSSAGSQTGRGWNVWLQTNYINFNVVGDSIARIRFSDASIFNNEWHHVAITYDGLSSANGMRMFVDGSQVGASPVAGQTSVTGSTANGSPVTIGALSPTNGAKFTGNLDDVRIFNVELTPQQVSDLASYDQITAGVVVQPGSVPGGAAVASANLFTDTNALSGLANIYRIFATNRVGQSLGIDESPSVTAIGPSSEPMSLQVTTAGSTNTLSWLPPTDFGGGDIMGYYVTRKAAGETTFREQPFTSRPISHWKFDGASTGSLDFGSLSNDLVLGSGTINYISSGSGVRIASSHSFNGLTFFTAPNEFNYDFFGENGAQPFSISFWMKADAQNNVAVISKASSGSFTSTGWNVWLQTNSISFNIANSTTNLAKDYERIRFSDAALFNNEWHHVAITYDGLSSANGMNMYVDGSSVTTSIISPDNISLEGDILNNNRVTIGVRSAATSTAKFTGNLDDVRIFNVELTPQQVSDLASYNLIGGTSLSDTVTGGTNSYKVFAVNSFGQSIPSSTGPAAAVTISFNEPSYQPDHSAIITVEDADANQRESAREVVFASAENTSTGGPEVRVTLKETDVNTGVFDNREDLLLFSQSGNDDSIPALGVSPGNSIQATFETDTATSSIGTGGGTFLAGTPLGSFVPISCSGQDIDLDGICDDWEPQAVASPGLTIPYNSQVYYLPCGAGTADPVCPDPLMKDVYVEVDWMLGHEPDQVAIDVVVDAFEERDIRLHVILDEPLNFHYPLIDWSSGGPNGEPSFFDIKQTHFGTPQERSAPNALDKLNAKRQVFHYALFAHGIENPSWSGIGEFLGNDFGVSLGSFVDHVGSPDHQAGTFMHELGHNLNLMHGGTIVPPDINCKPNYLSVMSYSRQFSEFIFDRPLDYSGQNLPALLQSSGTLNEQAGIGNPFTSGEKTVYGGINPATGQPFPMKIVMANNNPVDYDRDDTTTDATLSGLTIQYVDITGCRDNTTVDLQSFDDWDSLNFDFGDSGSVVDGMHVDHASLPEESREMTYDIVKRIRSLHIEALEDAVNSLDSGDFN